MEQEKKIPVYFYTQNVSSSFGNVYSRINAACHILAHIVVMSLVSRPFS